MNVSLIHIRLLVPSYVVTVIHFVATLTSYGFFLCFLQNFLSVLKIVISIVFLLGFHFL